MFPFFPCLVSGLRLFLIYSIAQNCWGTYTWLPEQSRPPLGSNFTEYSIGAFDNVDSANLTDISNEEHNERSYSYTGSTNKYHSGYHGHSDGMEGSSSSGASSSTSSSLNSSWSSKDGGPYPFNDDSIRTPTTPIDNLNLFG